MFWGEISRRDDTGSSESEFSNESDREQNSRHRPSRRSSGKSNSRHRHRKKQVSWLAGWFDSPPEKERKKTHKKARKTKVRSRICKPQSSQEWGLLFLTMLLSVYLVDFFSLLYRDSASIPTIAKVQGSQRNIESHSPRAEEGSGRSIDMNATVVGSYDGGRASSERHEVPKELADVKSGPKSASTYHDSIPGPPEALEGAESQTAPPPSGAANAMLTSEDLPRHPMNRNIPELQVPPDTGVLSLEAVKGYYRALAKAYLHTFTNGIYRQLYFDILRRRTYSLTPPGANKGVQTMLFQIIDNKVYLMDPYEVPRNSKPFYRTRINQVIWLLSKLAQEGRIKNTEFLMAIHDCVQTVNKPHSYRGAHYPESNPAFTIVTCNFSDNVPFPMWEGSKHRDGGFSGWDETVKKYAVDDTPWDQKFSKAVFRGGNRPSMYFKNKTDADLHCSAVGRTRLLYLSEQQPEVLDVSIGGSCGGVRTHLRRMEPQEHHKFKYILYAEGNCMWADRTRTQVFGPSTIIKQETPCGQFFEPLLKPDSHYIPTDFFFSDTVEKILWARENDKAAREIVRNANEFANNFLTLQGIEAYVQVLLEEYTKLLVEPDIKLENGAIDVTGKKV